jgi:hypothetical protein
MARALPGASYYAILSVLGTEVEKLDNEVLRSYLEQRLRDLEARIRALSQQSLAAAWQECQSVRPRLEAEGGTLALEAIWEELLELDYLETMWEAMAEALAAL